VHNRKSVGSFQEKGRASTSGFVHSSEPFEDMGIDSIKKWKKKTKRLGYFP